MSTLQNRLRLREHNKRLRKSAKSIKTPLQALRGALIGLLLVCVATISGCASSSNHKPELSGVTVDASLLVPANLTSQLLDALSESPKEETLK